MPQKTRQQKERAAQRRLEQVQPGTLVKSQFEFSLEEPKFQKAEPELKKEPEKSLHLTDTSLLVRDLVKTLILAASVFSLELVIYFLWFKWG